MVPTIVSERLELVAATLDHVLAEIDSSGRLAAVLGAEVGPGWPPGEYDREAQEFFRDRLREGGQEAVGWYCWYAVTRGDDGPAALVGAGGYLGPPDADGAVQIGFSVLPQWRNMGYGTEMAEMLTANALADARVRVVVADTTRDNAESRRVLVNAGFVEAGVGEDGGVRFEFRRNPGRPR